VKRHTRELSVAAVLTLLLVAMAILAPAFFAIGAISLVSLAFFLPLPRNAGAELHGLPARRGLPAG